MLSLLAQPPLTFEVFQVECQPPKETLKVSLHATLDDRYASIALMYDLDLDKWLILLLLVLQYLTCKLGIRSLSRSYLPHSTAFLSRSLGFYSILCIDTHDCITRTSYEGKQAQDYVQD
jgi:hypothetical protein